MKDKKKILNTIAVLALAAGIIMYMVGSGNPRLTELKDFFWSPLILSAVCFVAAKKQK